MKQLRYLEPARLFRKETEKQQNGADVDTLVFVEEYLVQIETLRDQAMATIYGARIENMLRISSVRNRLEKYLSDRMNRSGDNVSKYVIETRNAKYRIVAVLRKHLEIELL